MTTPEPDSYVDSSTSITGEAALSAPVVAALEHAWHAIRTRHPQVPAVVIVLATGSIGAPRGSLRLGHFAAMRWDHDTTSGSDPVNGQGESADRREALPEVFVGGEGLALGPVDVLGTLLHEAAHALAHTREIKDTSRQGRYHNRRYAALATELGLTVTDTRTIGWSDTRVPQATATEYAEVIDHLRVALTIQRRAEHALTAVPAGPDQPDDQDQNGDDDDQEHGGRKSNGNPTPCVCGCGRRIRVAPTVLDLGPIICSLCAQNFMPAGRT
jgi:hypothetical protein